MWNHLLHWRGEDWTLDVNQYLGTADGRLVLSTDGQAEQAMPYYYPNGDPAKFNGDYWLIRLVNSGPPIRAGEAIVGRREPGRRQDAVHGSTSPGSGACASCLTPAATRPPRQLPE